ncbi:SCO7613 C-terminal domain-containing membrane protein [Nocardioides sp. AX2bis]|uniref:SCO7613 C-terminal domain-containing membrane protein n=1 Tax=Nocardioides sp. AX2bis TaxID=2653157 RepID=UPI0012F1ED56|nr:hypothetical protein [Nocardioides sp. AX2bis]VXB98965.1 conserved membrane hypothetical protein [Nocardioides sp. AX2bis]
MARYADPGSCPDCRTVLPHAPAQCPTCALPLRGPTAAALLATLTRADELLAVLRASAPVTAPVPATAAGVPAPAPSAGPTGLRGSSVPRVLLGLGAACLLVAAVAFLAVAWSWLGVEGRTAVLVALTGSAATAAVVLARRPLPVAAEAFTTVALGLVALDVLGMRSSGWLGDLGAGGTTAVVGTASGLTAAALVAVTRHRGSAPVAAQVGTAIGLLLLAGGTVAGTGHLTSTATATVLAAALLAGLAHRLDLHAGADAAAVVAAAWWLGLTTVGLADAAADPSVRGLVLDGAGAGLLSAGLLAALPLAHPAVRRSRVAGPAAAAVSALLLTLLAVVPLADEGAGALLVGCLVGLAAWSALAVAAAAVAAAPARRWTTAIAAPQLVLALPAGLVALDLVSSAVGNVGRLVERVGSPGAAPLDAVLGSAVTATTPALLVPTVCLLALAGAVHLPARHRPTRLPAVAIAAVVALPVPAAAVALACLPVPLALVVAVAAVPALVAAALVLAGPGGRHRTPLLLAATVAAGTALLAALPSAALTALVLVPVAAVAAVLALTDEAGTRTRTVAAASLPLALGGLAWSVADVVDLAVADRALPVLLVVGVLAVLRPRLAVALGATAAAVPATVVALAALAASPATSAVGSASVSLAVHLTLAGALLTASAGLHPSRRLLAWPGGLLLAAATWVRLADLGVSAPEAYTLPTALVLVAVGVVRLRRDPAAATRTTLLPGLVLATLPSLLVVLAEDPVSPRAAALGLGCLVLLLAGARLRWSAPVVVGGAAGAVLVLAELAPYAAVVPQWLLLAAAGALLTAVGVTWEDRSADARRAARYLVRLR